MPIGKRTTEQPTSSTQQAATIQLQSAVQRAPLERTLPLVGQSNRQATDDIYAL